VEIALRGLEVSVAEHVADGHRVEYSRQQRSRRVAEVVEAQLRGAGEVADRDVAAAER
jgi:hypothetical protein